MAARMICPPYPTEGQSGEMAEPSAGVSTFCLGPIVIESVGLVSGGGVRVHPPGVAPVDN
jgi:hypothetical protein